MLALGACASMNPFRAAASNILKKPGATFCWAPIGAKYDQASCETNSSSLDLEACVEQLGAGASIFTPVDAAELELDQCMARKGWMIVLIEGGILTKA